MPARVGSRVQYGLSRIMSLVKALAGDKLTFPQAIPKRRDLAEGGAVKVERSRARGRVANFLTVQLGAIQSPAWNCVWFGLFQPQWDSNYRCLTNSSRVKPACSTIPFSVPGFRGLCCGTTTVLGPLRRIRCEPDCRSWTNPQCFSERTASTPLTSRGIFTTSRGSGLARSATGRSGDVDQVRNSLKRHRRS